MISPAAPISTNSAQAALSSTPSTPSAQPTISSSSSKVPLPAPLPTKAQWEIDLASAEQQLKAATERADALTIARIYNKIADIHSTRRPRTASSFYAAAEASRQAVIACFWDRKVARQIAATEILPGWRIHRNPAQGKSIATAGAVDNPFRELSDEGVRFWILLWELQSRLGIPSDNIIKLERFYVHGIEVIACGELHVDDEATAIVQLGANGKCVVGIEGYSQDPKMLKKQIKARNLPHKAGYQYGLEEPRVGLATKCTDIMLKIREAGAGRLAFADLYEFISVDMLHSREGLLMWNELTRRARESEPKPDYWPKIRMLHDLEQREVAVDSAEYMNAFVKDGKIDKALVDVWVNLLAELGDIAWTAAKISPEHLNLFRQLRDMVRADKAPSKQQLELCSQIEATLNRDTRNPHFINQGVNIIQQMEKDGVKGVPLFLNTGLNHIKELVRGINQAFAEGSSSAKAEASADRKEGKTDSSKG